MAQMMKTNPYIGPRTFTAEDSPWLFGRERETQELISLIVSERAVLFYAPSGAGKSSLINAKIAPGLAEEGFEVLPIGRVSGWSGSDTAARNIFILNLVMSLNQSGQDLGRFAEMDLPTFLNNLVLDDGVFGFDDRYVYTDDYVLKPRVLIIDQFEEMFSSNLGFWRQREEFFSQLGEALAQDDKLWLVLSMVEDSIGGLNPYTHYLPENLRHRYYMAKPDRPAALEMVKWPAEMAGRPFAEGAAEILVDNLLRFQAGDQDHSDNKVEFVERVLLQLVCYLMWEDLAEHPAPLITVEDVEAYADVDKIFNNLYDEAVTRTAAETGIAEIDLRNWMETKLITEDKKTARVLRDSEQSGGLPTAAIDQLQLNSHFIIDTVAGEEGLWYALASTGFIQPILNANFLWMHNQPLVQMAEKWEQDGRPDSLLLKGEPLEEVLATNWRAFGPPTTLYVEAGQRAQQLEQQMELEETAERVKELEGEQKRLRFWLAIIIVVALVLGLIALVGWLAG